MLPYLMIGSMVAGFVTACHRAGFFIAYFLSKKVSLIILVLTALLS